MGINRLRITVADTCFTISQLRGAKCEKFGKETVQWRINNLFYILEKLLQFKTAETQRSYLCTLLLCCPGCIFHRRVWYRALSLRYACIPCSASSSSLGYLCAKFHFCRAPTAELARGEKSDTQSLTYSTSLFDAVRTKAYRFGINNKKLNLGMEWRPSHRPPCSFRRYRSHGRTVSC